MDGVVERRVQHAHDVHEHVLEIPVQVYVVGELLEHRRAERLQAVVPELRLDVVFMITSCPV